MTATAGAPGREPRREPRPEPRNPRLRSSPWAYLWAFPATLPGLVIALAGLATGARCRLAGGVLEVEGGVVRPLLASPLLRAGAVALGHVILARDRRCLEHSRAHERVHVRQAEAWGPLFLPAYLAASLWALARGRHLYWDNRFERQARAESGDVEREGRRDGREPR